MRRILFLFLLCSAFMRANHEEIVHCNSSYQYDDDGNPVALKIRMQQILIPVVDGMRMEWQKQEHIVEQTFPIHNHTQIAECENCASMQMLNPENKPFFKAQSIDAQPLLQNTSSRFFTQVRIVEHQATTFEAMSNSELMQLILYDRYCRMWYHMNSSQKHNMMGFGYKKFEQKLLQDQTLLDWAVWELWQEYQNKRLWNIGNQKRAYEESIKLALELRKQSHQQEIETLFLKIVEAEKLKAEQDLIQKYKARRLHQGEIVQASFQHLKDFGNQHAIACDEFLQTCEEKLLASQLQCYEQYEMCYEFDSQTRGYLLCKNIDYKEFEIFTGTDLQQEFHGQTCKILKDAALLQSKVCHASELLTGACLVGVAAHEANKRELTAPTGAFCWIGSQLIKYSATTFGVVNRYGFAALEGVVESATDFIHMVTSPCETLCGIGKMLYFVLDTMTIAETFAEHPHNAPAASLAQQRKAEIKGGLKLLVEHCKKMDGPARVKALTKFGADFVVPGKIIGAFTYLLGGICSQAKGLRTAEGVMGMLFEDFGAEQALEYAVEGAGKVAHQEGACSEILTEFLEAENHLSKANKIARSLKAIIDEIRNVHKGVIPPHCSDLKKELEIVLAEIKKSLKNAATEKIKDLYKKKKIDGKQVEILLDHIFEAEFKFKKCSTTGGHILEIKGGHLPGMCEKLEQAGIAKILQREVLPCGSVQYKMQNMVTGEIYPKRVFPPLWGEEKIAKSICEAYETGAIKYTSKEVPYRNKTIDGVQVSVFYKDSVTTTGKGVMSQGKIVSAVPYGDIK